MSMYVDVYYGSLISKEIAGEHKIKDLNKTIFKIPIGDNYIKGLQLEVDYSILYSLEHKILESFHNYQISEESEISREEAKLLCKNIPDDIPEHKFYIVTYYY